MITVNGKKMEWREDITFQDIFKYLGYNIKSPKVIALVNGKPVRKEERDSFKIPDGAEIEIISAISGG